MSNENPNHKETSGQEKMGRVNISESVRHEAQGVMLQYSHCFTPKAMRKIRHAVDNEQ